MKAACDIHIINSIRYFNVKHYTKANNQVIMSKEK